MPDHYNLFIAIKNLNNINYQITHKHNNLILNRFVYFFYCAQAQEIKNLNVRALKINLEEVKKQIDNKEIRISAEILEEILINLTTLEIHTIIKIQNFLYNLSLTTYLTSASINEQHEYISAIAEFSKLINKAIIKIIPNHEPVYKINNTQQRMLQIADDKTTITTATNKEIPNIIADLQNNFLSKTVSIKETITSLHNALNLHYNPGSILENSKETAILLSMIHNIPYSYKPLRDITPQLKQHALYPFYELFHKYIYYAEEKKRPRRKAIFIKILRNFFFFTAQETQSTANDLEHLQSFYYKTRQGKNQLLANITTNGGIQILKKEYETTLISLIATLHNTHKNHPQVLFEQLVILANTLQHPNFPYTDYVTNMFFENILTYKKFAGITQEEHLQYLDKLTERNTRMSREIKKDKMAILPPKINITTEPIPIHKIASTITLKAIKPEDMQYAAHYSTKYITHSKAQPATIYDALQLPIVLYNSTEMQTKILQEIQHNLSQDIEYIQQYLSTQTTTAEELLEDQTTTEEKKHSLPIMHKIKINFVEQKTALDKVINLLEEDKERAKDLLQNTINMITQNITLLTNKIKYFDETLQSKEQHEEHDLACSILQNLQIRNLQIINITRVVHREIKNEAKLQLHEPITIKSKGLQGTISMIVFGIMHLQVLGEIIKKNHKLNIQESPTSTQTHQTSQTWQQIIELDTQQSYEYLRETIQILLKYTNIDTSRLLNTLANHITSQKKCIQSYYLLNPENTQKQKASLFTMASKTDSMAPYYPSSQIQHASGTKTTPVGMQQQHPAQPYPAQPYYIAQDGATCLYPGMQQPYQSQPYPAQPYYIAQDGATCLYPGMQQPYQSQPYPAQPYYIAQDGATCLYPGMQQPYQSQPYPAQLCYIAQDGTTCLYPGMQQPYQSQPYPAQLCYIAQDGTTCLYPVMQHITTENSQNNPNTKLTMAATTYYRTPDGATI